MTEMKPVSFLITSLCLFLASFIYSGNALHASMGFFGGRYIADAAPNAPASKNKQPKRGPLSRSQGLHDVTNGVAGHARFVCWKLVFDPREGRKNPLRKSS